MGNTPKRDGKTCPTCGSSQTKAVPAQMGEGFSVVRDRVCQACGARFTPPTPAWAPWVLMVCGVALIVGSVAVFVVALREGHLMGRLSILVVIGVAVFSAGLGMLLSQRDASGDDANAARTDGEE